MELIILLMLLLLGLIYYRASAFLWIILTLIFFLCFLIMVAMALVTPIYWLISIIFYFCLLLLGYFPKIRQKIITVHLLNWAQYKMPKFSAAERDIWMQASQGWEKQLFSGSPDWSKLVAHSDSSSAKTAPVLSALEQSFLDHEVMEVCQLLDDMQFTDTDVDLPERVWVYLRENRFWGLMIPKRYGGHEFSATAHAEIITRLASRSYSLAITVMVPNSVGPAELIQYFGTQQQKNDYLPRLASGAEIPCFALTSLEAGSDAAGMMDSGIIGYYSFEGENHLSICLNWSKRYITLAPKATLIALAFKLYDPEHLWSQQEDLGITLALVPSSLSGVNLGLRHHPMHLAFMNGPIEGKNVVIPIEWVVGGTAGFGRGWHMILSRLAIGRGISLPALTVSSAMTCLAGTSAYTVVRQQFHRSIAEFEAIQLKLSKMAGLSYLCQAVQKMLVQQIDSGQEPAVASAIAKYHLTEFNRWIVNAAFDIHGGKSIQTGPRNYLTHLYLAVPINITVEGSNILTRNLIIFGQSVSAYHPFLFQELTALEQKDPQTRLKKFDAVIWKHIYQTVHMSLRVLVYGLTGGRFIKIRHSLGCHNWQKQLTRMSAAFLLMVDITLLCVHKHLKTKEALSSRLGDILSYLYLASAAISSYQAHRNEIAEYHITEWCIRFCLAHVSNTVIDLLANYPKPWLGWLLRKWIFPWGNTYLLPADDLSFSVAQHFLKQSPLRQRMIKQCYWGKLSGLTAVEVAMRYFCEAWPMLTQLASYFPGKQPSDFLMEHEPDQWLSIGLKQGFLNQEKADWLRKMYVYCREAILVDQNNSG